MLHIKHSGMEGSSLPLIGMYPLSVSLPFLPPLFCVLSHFSRVQLFVIPWTVACQAPLSMGFFSRQEYWNGLPFPSPRGLPNPGMELKSFTSPAVAGWFFTTSATWEALFKSIICFPTCRRDRGRRIYELSTQIFHMKKSSSTDMTIDIDI